MRVSAGRTGAVNASRWRPREADFAQNPHEMFVSLQTSNRAGGIKETVGKRPLLRFERPFPHAPATAGRAVRAPFAPLVSAAGFQRKHHAVNDLPTLRRRAGGDLNDRLGPRLMPCKRPGGG